MSVIAVSRIILCTTVQLV